MKQHIAIIAVLLLVVSQNNAVAQEASTNLNVPTMNTRPLVGNDAFIPEGYSLHLSSAFSPFEQNTSFVYGTMSLGIVGLLEASLTKESAIGTPLGWAEPANQLGLRLQVAPQRDNYPAVALFLNTMLKAQTEFLGDNDLMPNFPDLYRRGILAISYQAKTTTAGVALTTQLNDFVTLNASIGTREIVWRQGWSAYSSDNSSQKTVDGWTAPLAEQSAYRIDALGGFTFHPLSKLAVIGDVGTIPSMDIDPSSLTIEATQDFTGAFGVRYYLPVPLTVELYDRWFSSSTLKTFHQIRLGLSADIAAQ